MIWPVWPLISPPPADAGAHLLAELVHLHDARRHRGVVLALVATGTTLNIQSFMGAIMAVGVAVANAILLAGFAEDPGQRRGREAQAGKWAGGVRPG
jgi:hypothetical protein